MIFPNIFKKGWTEVKFWYGKRKKDGSVISVSIKSNITYKDAVNWKFITERGKFFPVGSLGLRRHQRQLTV